MRSEVEKRTSRSITDTQNPSPKRMAARNRRIDTKNRLEGQRKEDAIEESVKIKTRWSPDDVLHAVWHGLGPSKGIDST